MRRIPELALALGLGAGVAPAQQTDRATFYLIVGNDTATVERMERGGSELRFQLYDLKGRGRVDFVGYVARGSLLDSLTQSMFVSSTDATPAMRVEARFHGDSVGIQRGGATNWVRVGAGALPGLNVSVTLLEQTVMRARVLGGDSVSIPLMFLPGGPAVPVSIAFRPDSAIARMAGVAIHMRVSPEGKVLGAVIPSQGARFARGPAIEAAPVQTSYGPPAGAPYSAQDVTIRTPAGITLRGTLTLPQRAPGTPVPAIVTITGSGPQNRDGTSSGLRAYRPYYQLADTLGRRGIAVLRLDDRGAGSDMGSLTVTSADFADDIRSAIGWLRSRPEIDGRRIGLVGHSEGGIIAPMVAATDSLLRGIVLMAGTASTGRQILTLQQQYAVDSLARVTGQQRAQALAQYARSTDSMAAAMPWMRFFLDYDPVPTAARVRAPVLILQGEKDFQVPAAEAERIAAAVRSGGNRDVTVQVFPGLNHLFLDDPGVGFSYEKLPSFVVGPAVMGAIADWLSARLTR